MLTALTAAGLAGPLSALECQAPTAIPEAADTGCNHVLVTLNPEQKDALLDTMAASRMRAELKRLGVTKVTVGVGSLPDVLVLEVNPEVLKSPDRLKRLCDELQKRPSVGTLQTFERSARWTHRAVQPNDPHFPDQRRLLEQVNAVAAWDRISKIHLDPVRVAVADTGVRYRHPDLREAMWNERLRAPVHGQNFSGIGTQDDTDDTYGHGTTVAGVLAATSDNGVGIASIPWRDHVQIVIAKFTTDDRDVCVDAAVKAIDYAANQANARVINLSFGTAEDSPVLLNELRYLAAHNKQTLIVAAVPNERHDLDDSSGNFRDYPTSYHLPNVISVEASDYRGRFGSSAYGHSSVHIAAPGFGLKTTDIKGSTYSTGMGTSMSAPQVSATAALISEFAPDWDYLKVKEYLIDSARNPACADALPSQDFFAICDKSVSGGVLNVDAATGAPLEFTWPANASVWRQGQSHEVTWRNLFGTDLCREVQFLYSTDGGRWWYPVSKPGAIAHVTTLYQSMTLPNDIPPGTPTRLSARCTDTSRLERWSRTFVIERAE